ncbi:BamA/TamA family outer membrane protein [Hymenobacter koreensis]
MASCLSATPAAKGKRGYQVLGLLWLMLLVGLPSRAQPTQTSFWRKLSPDSLTNRPLRFIPVPVLQSTPETGLRGGIALDYFFNSGTWPARLPEELRRPGAPTDSARLATRDSFAFVQALYSTRRQLTLETVWQAYSPAERYILRGRAGYQDFSEYYWGVGNETLAEKERNNVFYQRWYAQPRTWRRVQGNFFAGLSYHFSQTQRLRLDDEMLGYEALAGSDGSRVSGLGPSLLADYRNNPFSPTRGWYAEWTMHNFGRALGSQFRYTEYLFDMRRYLRLPRQSTLGLQAVGHFTSGTVPLLELPRLGGPTIMRGFVQGRYRDQQLWSMQAEYRYPLNRFLVGAVFASAGGVAASVPDFAWNNTRYAGGGGLRVLLNRKKNLYARLDQAFTSNGTSNFYFRVMDAF